MHATDLEIRASTPAGDDPFQALAAELYSSAERGWMEIFDSISDLIVVHDQENRVLRGNRSLAQVIGVDPVGLIGVQMGTLLSFAGDGGAGPCPLCRMALAGEEEFTHPAMQRTYLVSRSRLRGGGHSEQTIHVLKDITDRLDAERRYRELFDNIQEGIFFSTPEGRFVEVNDALVRILGYENREELLQVDIPGQLYRSPADRWPFLEAIEGNGVIRNFQEVLRRKDGSLVHTLENAFAVRDAHGRLVQYRGVVLDITDSVLMKANLVHAEKMAAVGQLVSGVAHEVNNPLTAILGFADLLLQQDLAESVRKDLQVIVHEAQRTKQIVQNLLSFARQTPQQRQPVDLISILRRTLQLRSYDLTSRGLQVVERLDETLPKVIGDPHQLQQVFLNILNNAYDAVSETGRPGQIELETSAAGGLVEIRFTDNGPGISHPERIFDPFFTTKEIGKGTGLGLSICYGIVHEHQGELVAYNNSDRPGATFIVRLPMAVEGDACRAAVGGSA